MTKLVLGLDIGITSVGYGIIDIDSGFCLDYGVRLFKEGTAANNEGRRSSRGRRRLTRRKENRIHDMKTLLQENGIMEKDYKPINNVYEIRCKGLHEKLNNQELTSAILHITKHRGSVLETVDDDEEASADAQKSKEVLSANSRELRKGKYLCEVQMERLKNGKVRGHSNNFKTEDYVKELREILNHQNLEESLCDKIISIVQRRRAYYEGPGSKKSPTPYGRFIEENGQIKQIDLIEKMIGKCSVFPDELRAPKMSVTAELFNFLNDLNNISVKNEKLTKEEKDLILDHIDKKGTIKLKDLAKVIGVKESDVTGFRIDSKDNPIFTEFKGYKKIKKIFKENGESVSLKDYEKLDYAIDIITKKKGIEERKESLIHSDFEYSNSVIEALAITTGFTGYHSLSFKAMRMLNEELYQTSMNQMQLLHELKLFDKNRASFKGKKNIEADPEAILSPVAKRAQNECFKVVNALRKEYGEFDSIVVEMTRDKNSVERKKRIKDSQKRFEENNKAVTKLLKEHGLDPDKVNGKTKTKIRLYLQQEGKSAYTLQTLDLTRLIKDDTYTEIDHIIPLSISLDDSLQNKVLALHSENQVKGNLTPIMAYQNGKFNGMGTTITDFKTFVLSNRNYSRKKRNNLLFEKDINKYDVIKEFINRNMIDTSYANRVVLNTLQDYFKDNEIDTKVHTINGRLTDLFRKRINLPKDRDEDYLHHAIDALIVASIKKLRLLNGYLAKYDLDTIYDEMTGEIKDIPDDKALLDPKYFSFILDLKTIYDESNKYYNGIIPRDKMTFNPIKISHKVDTKPNRQIADETIYSTRKIDGADMLIQKYPDKKNPDIYGKKFTNLAEDIINGKSDKYLMAKHDPQTFQKFVDIVMDHFETYKDSTEFYKKDKKGQYKIVGDNPLYIYKEQFGPVTKYAKKNNGPVVNSLKYVQEKLGNHIDISKNYDTQNKKVILKQISPYRTDIYKCQDGKYRFVTVRYKDVFYKQSTNTYVIDKEWYEKEKQRKNISDKDEFQFSMHRDELIGVSKKENQKYIYDSSTENEGITRYYDGETLEILKFTATNDDTQGTIEVKPTYTYCKKRLRPGVGTFAIVKKYSTDVLGNIYEVKNSKLKLEFD